MRIHITFLFRCFTRTADSMAAAGAIALFTTDWKNNVEMQLLGIAATMEENKPERRDEEGDGRHAEHSGCIEDKSE